MDQEQSYSPTFKAMWGWSLYFRLVYWPGRYKDRAMAWAIL